MTDIDWSGFDEYPKPEVSCRCGATYWSHTKLVSKKDGVTGREGFDHHSQKPCPGCGEKLNNMRRVSHPPEKWTL